MNRDYLMTMLFKECSNQHGIRSCEEDIVVAIDPRDQRCEVGIHGPQSCWSCF